MDDENNQINVLDIVVKVQFYPITTPKDLNDKPQ